MGASPEVGGAETATRRALPSTTAAAPECTPVVTPAAVDLLPVLRPRSVALLQRAAGNRAVSGVLGRSAVARPRPGRVVVQRDDPPGAPRTAIVHDHHQLTADGPALRREIQKVILERGWGSARVWASAFTAAEPATFLRYHPDESYVVEVRRLLGQEMTVMEGSVKQLTGTPTLDLGDVVIGQGDFDRHLDRNARHLLDNSEVQLRKEAARFGVKESGWVFKDYSMTVGPEQAKLQTEARRLAELRAKGDTLRFTFVRLQKQAERTGREFEPTARAVLGSTAEDAARVEWIAHEDAYLAECRKVQAEFPVLAAYTTGADAATQLQAVATEGSAQLAERLYKTIDERIKNVAEVREGLGRLNLWTQPQLVALTKSLGGFEPWEARVIDEAVAKAKADDAEREKIWTVLAVGLGLLSAIPTGGTTGLAMVAAAGATLGAAFSLGTLYEHYKDYTLATAASGMSLDKAKAISADDPSLLWLAFDLLDVGLNVVGAAAAFKSLKAAVAAAEAGGAAALPEVFRAADRAGLTAASKGKLARLVLDPKGGPRAVQEMLQGIRETILQAGAGRAPDLIEACKKAADTVLAQQRVGIIRATKGQTLNEIERVLRAAGEVEPEVGRVARTIYHDLGSKRMLGGYYPKFDIILLQEGQDMASTLIHELAHRSQNFERKLHMIGTMRREFQAYHAEREFLLALPDTVEISPGAATIRGATEEGLKAQVLAEYADELQADAWLYPSMPPLDEATDMALVAEWFKKLAAWR